MRGDFIKSKRAFYTGTHQFSFRCGERAEIIGVRLVLTPVGDKPCFLVCYTDGTLDYTLIDDDDNYKIEGEV